MSFATARKAFVRLALLGVLLGLGTAMTSCSKAATTDSAASGEPAAEQPASEQAPQEPEKPEYTSWQIYVNDDDSYEKSGITYDIVLNLTATNPTPDVAGKYKGKATASTSSTGEYRGKQLNASAIANSSKLVFELKDPAAGGALATLTEGELPTYSGSGTIVMKAAGGGTYGAAGGSFSNTSGQNLSVSVTGTEVTLEVEIDGHTYSFNGTLSGK